MTSRSWVVDIDPVVPDRMRLLRGVFWAQVLAAMTLVPTGMFAFGRVLKWLVFEPFGIDQASVPSAVVAIPMILIGLCLAVAAFRFIGRLRTGSLAAARITLVLGLMWLFAGVLALRSGAFETSDGCGAWWLDSLCGFYKGIGRSAYEISEGVTQTPGTTVYYAIVLAVLLNSTTLGESLRRSAWARFRLIRWPVLYLCGVLAIALPLAAVEVFKDGLWSVSQVGVMVILPILFMALRAACEILQPRAATVLAPAWEPSAVRRTAWFGGRRRVRVALLILASVLCGALWYLLTMSLPTSIENSLLASDDSSVSLKDLAGLRMIAFAFPLLFLVLAVELYTRARRNAAISATALRDQDSRLPYLYLRPFTDDSLKVSTHGSPRHSWFESFLLRRRERFEVMLIWHLWRFGPVVCIGRPLENLPLLGAARDYLSDSEWRDGVESRIREAAAVVVVLGHSDGLVWELEAIERLGARGKTLIVIPPVSDQAIAERWDAFDDVAGKLGWQPVASDRRADVLLATLQPDAAHAGTETAGPGDETSTWALFRGSVRDEWHYEIALETALRYIERRRKAGIAALAVPTDSRKSGPPADGMSAAARAFAARLFRRWSEGPLLVVLILYVGVAFALVGDPGRTERVFDLHRGMCISEIPASVAKSVDADNALLLDGRVFVNSCYETHAYEVSTTRLLDFDQYPAKEALRAAADSICAAALDAYTATAGSNHSLDYDWFAPTLVEWKFGFRDVVCVAYDRRGALTSKLGTEVD